MKKIKKCLLVTHNYKDVTWKFTQLFDTDL